MTDAILNAMRADMIRADTSGRWSVTKASLSKRDSDIMGAALDVQKKRPTLRVPPGSYTWLRCLTFETMMQPPGETVMNDFPCELRKHMEFIMHARGRVLVGGLGLGCVIRGLLTRGLVESIDVVERSEDVINLCGDSITDPRVTIQHHSAEFAKGGPWDWAWWDLWSDPEKSEPHLQVIHMDLVKRFDGRVRNMQGAWAMPRQFRKPLRRAGVML